MSHSPAIDEGMPAPSKTHNPAHPTHLGGQANRQADAAHRGHQGADIHAVGRQGSGASGQEDGAGQEGAQRAKQGNHEVLGAAPEGVGWVGGVGGVWVRWGEPVP